MYKRLSFKKIVVDDSKGLYYTRTIIPKSGGKVREIHALSPRLKEIHYRVYDELTEMTKIYFENNPWITGCVKGRSIVDNVRPHLDAEWILKKDIKNFFPSISGRLVERVLDAYLGEDMLCDMEQEYGMSIPSLFTLNDKLVQGSPVSPIIANIIGSTFLDKTVLRIIYNMKQDLSIAYTRYVDDLTFSIPSGMGSRQAIEDLNVMINKHITMQNYFSFNERKTKIIHKSQKQKITGIVIGSNGPGADKSLRNKLRAKLYLLKKENKELDENIKGILGFIKSINENQYKQLIRSYCNEN